MKPYNEMLGARLNEKGQEVLSDEPIHVEIPLSRPLSLTEEVAKYMARAQYTQAMNRLSNDNIDDDDDDQVNFSQAELNYQEAQKELKAKKEQYFKAAQEKQQADAARADAEYKAKVKADAEKLGLIPKADG